ncbi:beta-ketoacyl synthase N-terminal-like domain-containing protein, partial [Bacillus cereus]|uniref:beta-ketoacyl synthase N-terminal-like domain-containing protein n=1 Tax=Bacillus cereus TaxID=1396 RepID=UPI0024BEF173
FDPLFWNWSPREAETKDPNQRLLLQEAWRALEDAGYGATHIRQQTIGMSVGAEEGDYHPLTRDKGNVTSHHNGILAARLAYLSDLSGPV